MKYLALIIAHSFYILFLSDCFSGTSVEKPNSFVITEIESLEINHVKEWDSYWGGEIISTIEISGKIKNNEILIIRPDIELKLKLYQKNGKVIDNESVFGERVSNGGLLSGFENTYTTLIDGFTTSLSDKNWDSNKIWKPGTELDFNCTSARIYNVIFEYEIDKAELYLYFSADDPATTRNSLHKDVEELLEVIDITKEWGEAQEKVLEYHAQKEAEIKRKAAPSPKKQVTEQEGKVGERALYGTRKGTSGASLELAGWQWDFLPKPNDTSNENGKIVFQITIDDEGYIIGVKTLEKTVSPEVEKIYRQAVEELSFSKTSENIRPAPTSTGKITFIIRSREE